MLIPCVQTNLHILDNIGQITVGHLLIHFLAQCLVHVSGWFCQIVSSPIQSHAVLFRINHYCLQTRSSKKESSNVLQCTFCTVQTFKSYSFRLLKKSDFAFRILLNAGLIVQFSSITSIFHHFILYRVTGRWSLSKI